MRKIDADTLRVDELADADYWSTEMVYRSDVQNMIDNVPTIQDERQGYWIENKNSHSYRECSECGYEVPWFSDSGWFLSNYCPQCGAKMEGLF